MRRTDRLDAILERVADGGSVDVGDLAEALGVSGATIRRDLQHLDADRLLVRTHGGAVARDGHEPPPRVKQALRQAEKRRVGRAAAALVGEGAVVGMTGGSTTTEVARALPELRGITVVTNAINIAAELVTRPGLRLVVIGGVARPSSYELVGAAAEAMLAKYHLDLAFVGVDGLTPEEGLTTHDEMEAHTDLAFISRAQRSIVVADSSKVGRVTFAHISPLSALTDVITDDGLTPGQLEGLRGTGVRVTLV